MVFSELKVGQLFSLPEDGNQLISSFPRGSIKKLDGCRAMFLGPYRPYQNSGAFAELGRKSFIFSVREDAQVEV